MYSRKQNSLSRRNWCKIGMEIEVVVTWVTTEFLLFGKCVSSLCILWNKQVYAFFFVSISKMNFAQHFIFAIAKFALKYIDKKPS